MPRVYACDDYVAIREHMAKIRDDERQRCPISPSKFLGDCLKEAVKCPEACPHRADWVGGAA